MTDTATALPLLLTDVPSDEDALGFKPHASNLAAMLLKQQFPDASFVVGIEGVWGEGKSTFIKFLKKRFSETQSGEVPPVVVDFNPWWFESPEKIMTHLLDSMLGQADKLDAEARDLLIKLAEIVKDNNQGVEKFTNSLLYVNGFLGAGGVAAASNGYWVGVALALVLSVLAKIIHDCLQKNRVISDSLSGKKKALSEKFSKNRQKLVVVIDDIDRLSHEEIRHVFRAIKGILDLPNVIYVVAYDRTIVASALDAVHANMGEAYLEKIIQYPYVLPKPHALAYQNYVLGILAMVLDVPAKNLDEHSVRMIVGAFLPVPRSVKRLCATLLDFKFYSSDCVDINPVDYLFLEAVRLYDRTLYVELISALLGAATFPESNSKGSQASWVSERFSMSLEKFKNNPEVFDCISCFTGLSFSVKGEGISRGFLVEKLWGIPIYGTISTEKRGRLAGFVRAYVAKGRDQDGVSRFDVNSFILVKTKEDFSVYLKGMSAVKVSNLFWSLEHYSREWIDGAGVINFSRSWISFIRDGLLSGEEQVCGISFSDLFGLYLRIFGGLVERRFEEGGDGKVLLDIFNEFFDIGSNDIFWSVIFFVSGWAGRDYMLNRGIISRDVILDGALDKKDMSALLSVGIFKSIFLEIRVNMPDAVEAWLASLECAALSNRKSIIKLSEFIVYVELEVKEIEALRKNHSFVALLRKYQKQLLEMFGQPEHHARYARLVEEA